jgi:hypothetical protein
VQRFRVDTTGATFRVDAVEPKTDQHGNQVKDKQGANKYVVHLTVRETGRVRPDQWAVTVAGEPKITPDGYVQLRGVVAVYWERGDMSGVALSAESVTAIAGPAAPSVSKNAA